jgi:hypothetical protein
LTWQQKTVLDALDSSVSSSADHAFARVEVVVLGDEVTNYRTYIKIPDEWRRKHEEFSLARIILGYAVPILFVGGLVIIVLIVFLMNLRSDAARSIPWKRLARWALWGLGAYALMLAFGDFVPNALNAYKTAIPLKTMLGITAISALLGALFSYGFLALLFGAAWYYGTRAFAEERLPSWAGMPAAYYRDALFIGLGGTAAWVGLDAISKWINLHWPSAQQAAGASFGASLDSAIPAATIIGSAVRGGLMWTALVALAASFIASLIRPIWMRAGVFALVVLSLGGFASNWSDPRDVAMKMVIAVMWIVAIDVTVRYVVRFNVLGYFLILASLVLLAGASELLGQPDHFYRVNGYGVLTALAVLLVWPLFAWSRANSAPAARQPESLFHRETGRQCD